MTEIDRLVLAYEALKAEVEPLLFVARDLGLQEAAIAKARAFVERVEQARLGAILESNEEKANDLLALGCVGKGFISELSVFVLLKRGESNQAWDALIDAQDMVGTAARASPHLTNLNAKFEHLHEMEGWFLPPQQFTSIGAIVREQHCSICRSDYALCNHIAGRPYMGRMCSIVLKQCSLDHISMVEHPADRRCRLMSMNVPGGQRNHMTWVVTPSESGGLYTVRGIAAVASAVEDETVEHQVDRS